MPSLFARCLVPGGVTALAGLCLLPGHAHAQCQYDVTVLQFPINCEFGLPVITSGLSLNENGAVVGYYYCPTWEHDEAFLWTPEGGFVTLDRPPGVSSAIAADINDQGIVCGEMIVSGVGKRGFVYEDGLWTQLPPVVPDRGSSWASAITNAGVVVGGRSITEGVAPFNAYLWSSTDGFTDLGLMNGPYSAARDISEGWHVVGWTGNGGSINEAFLWEEDKLTLLGPIPGGFTSTASAVSSMGTIVGSGRIPMKGAPVGAGRAFLWENGEFTMLGTLPDHTRSGAGDVSDARIVVGISSNVGGNPNISHGFVWQNGTMHNLNDLIPPELELLIQSAGSIANNGQIVARGHNPKGDVVAFLLTPIQPVGDLDADCRVGILDLLTLLADWGEPDSPADLNDDGIVNVFDLLILLANWT